MTRYEQQRFQTLRQRVMKAITEELKRDDYCKSYEGTFEIVTCYPDYFEDESGKCGPNAYCVRLHCYVLGPNRHYEWFGNTLSEALDDAERDINRWIMEEASDG